MTQITVSATINAPIAKVRDMRNQPEHIMQRAFATDTRECPSATNDLRVDGKFNTRMQAKDGSMGFDFTGTYTQVDEHKFISYTMDGEDARKVTVSFESQDDGTTKVTESFDPEKLNPLEMQQAGWQSILDNFKKHVETN